MTATTLNDRTNEILAMDQHLVHSFPDLHSCVWANLERRRSSLVEFCNHLLSEMREHIEALGSGNRPHTE